MCPYLSDLEGPTVTILILKKTDFISPVHNVYSLSNRHKHLYINNSNNNNKYVTFCTDNTCNITGIEEQMKKIFNFFFFFCLTTIIFYLCLLLSNCVNIIYMIKLIKSFWNHYNIIITIKPEQ